MKRNLTIKMTRILIASTMILWASGAMAKCAGNTTATGDEDLFKLVPIEVPNVGSDISIHFEGPSDAYIQELLEELISFKEESRPLMHDIESNWGALTNELSKQDPEVEKIADLQERITKLDTQLATLRLEHLQAVNKIKTTPSGERQLLASR